MKILNINYDNITMDAALQRAMFLLAGDKKTNIFFLNADCLYKAQTDAGYRNILNSADLILPDGIGLEVATRLFGNRMSGNCNGSDFSPAFMARAAKDGYKMFFLGGREGVAKKAAQNIKKAIPGIEIVGTHAGYFQDSDGVIEQINNSGTDILFVAMGVPLQEKWISANRDNLNAKLCLGVGALLDYLSGNIRRAPKIIRAIHMEWAWRILMEPKRLWKRYLVYGAKFFWLALKERFNNK